jgi:translocator protein
MTSFIPSLTLPAAVFANPAASILLPIALGTAVGFTVQRMSKYFLFPNSKYLINTIPAKESQKTYLALKQPPFRPPPWIFGPAWTVLYGLMGYSAYRAYNTGTNPLASAEKLLLTKQGATLYTVQLGLNLVVRALSTPVPNLLSPKTPTNLSS